MPRESLVGVYERQQSVARGLATFSPPLSASLCYVTQYNN